MNQELWSCLESFSFDDSRSSLAFSRRLGRENGWDETFTGRVLEEYRRFLYLCVEAGHPVTPSDEVDQAWHLHLCYTRSYWEDLCRETLGRPLHHGPTRGGPEERAKFHDWYARTLESYEEHFGTPPPADIWPDSRARFSSDFRRVDLARNWVVPRIAPRLAAAGLAGALLLAGCDSLAGDGLDIPIAWALLVAFLVIVIIAIAVRSGGGGGGGKGSGWFGGCGGGGCGGDSGCGGGGCGGGCGS